MLNLAFFPPTIQIRPIFIPQLGERKPSRGLAWSIEVCSCARLMFVVSFRISMLGSTFIPISSWIYQCAPCPAWAPWALSPCTARPWGPPEIPVLGGAASHPWLHQAKLWTLWKICSFEEQMSWPEAPGSVEGFLLDLVAAYTFTVGSKGVHPRIVPCSF